MHFHPPASLHAAAALALALAGCATVPAPQAALAAAPPLVAEPATGAKPELGLMGTIPLFWGESAGIDEVLGGTGEAHWARAHLEERFALRPLAALTPETLAGLDYLVLAQPRGLAPAENVALDAWVREGGKLLLFADPMLTGESRFGIGDRRRPQDVILLSPILAHWGLDLQFDDASPPAAQTREIAGTAVPLNLPGRFAPPMQGNCTLEAAEVLADCKIGEGRAVVLADAALLDLHHPAPQAAPALAMLLERAFGRGIARDAAQRAPDSGENAGTATPQGAGRGDSGPEQMQEPVQSPP